MSNPRHKLYYWPLPFRGCFVSYLFAYADVPLLEETNFDEIIRLKNLSPSEQDVPFIGPPVLSNLETGEAISQMPAIVLSVAPELGLMPKDARYVTRCLKVLMDCNDVLMEICRYNGSIMWEREEWVRFRTQRLPRWMKVFEESLKRGVIGKRDVSFADVGTFALFGNMTRCLPELGEDLQKHAPGIASLCQKIGETQSLARYVAWQREQYGELYCGGEIEKSIREMLRLDGE